MTFDPTITFSDLLFVAAQVGGFIWLVIRLGRRIDAVSAEQKFSDGQLKGKIELLDQRCKFIEEKNALESIGHNAWRDQMQKSLDRINERLDNINEKLDDKADKH